MMNLIHFLYFHFLRREASEDLSMCAFEGFLSAFYEPHSARSPEPRGYIYIYK